VKSCKLRTRPSAFNGRLKIGSTVLVNTPNDVLTTCTGFVIINESEEHDERFDTDALR
jgi:hypothetical protein